jgi:hypothetical protein
MLGDVMLKNSLSFDSLVFGAFCRMPQLHKFDLRESGRMVA